MKRPKILIISLGGTIFMQRRNSDSMLAPAVLGRRYRPEADFPELSEFADCEFKELAAEDSSNLHGEYWTRAADCIANHHQNTDGFVVVQGTDTLAFTAAALAFALQGIEKPVALTGAQIRKDDVGSDANTNIVNAARVAALRNANGRAVIREVAVVFGRWIIRATRARKTCERDLDAFSSVNVRPLGKVGMEIRIDSHMLLRPRRWWSGREFRPAPKFDSRVSMVHVYPAMDPELFYEIGRRSSGVVLAGFGAGNIPSNGERCQNRFALEPVIQALVREHGIPVVLTTQCQTGHAERGLYEAGNCAARAGAIVVNDMTPECALVKLAWVLANAQAWPPDARRALNGGPGRMGAIKHAMLASLAGEIISENGELSAEF